MLNCSFKMSEHLNAPFLLVSEVRQPQCGRRIRIRTHGNIFKNFIRNRELCLLSTRFQHGCRQEEVCVSVFTVVALKPPLAKHHIGKKTTEEFIIQQYKQASLKKYYKSFFTGV